MLPRELFAEQGFLVVATMCPAIYLTYHIIKDGFYMKERKTVS